MTDVAETGVYNSRYEIIRKIARGGMAEVYLARDLQLHRSVALKVLFRELSTDQAFVQRFRHEAQAAANLSHPNIVSIYDWGESEADNTYFIVMEFVDGDTLSKLIRSRGSLEAPRAAEIGSDISAGLEYAHAHGVIHRDVKPGNVIVTKEGAAKVTDFGIARGHNSDMSLTQTGAVMGTATYFSPEQAQGERVDARSDIYSLAVVLYEMIIGKPPFSGDNPIAIATKHVQEMPPAPSDIDPTIPEAFEAIVMKAMAKSPDDRYQSAGELHDDLARFVAGERVSAPAYDPSVTTFFDAGSTTIVQPRSPRTRAGAMNGNGNPAGRVPGDGSPPRPGLRIAAIVVALVVLAAALGLGSFYAVRHIGTGGGSGFDVPNVQGLKLSKAESRLTAAGLRFKVVQTASTDPPLTVVQQRPPYPTPVSRGDTVTLVISKGGQASVPDVVGTGKDSAVSSLRAAGFTVQTVNKTIPCSQVGQYSPPPTIGTVLAQAPSSGAHQVGSTVTITVSQGVPVPNVVGQSAADASNVLGQCGFTLGTTTNSPSPPDQSIPQGDVISINPGAGTFADPGTTVSLTVSTGTGVKVPDVVGESLGQAETDIENAGLTYTITYQNASNTCQSGYICGETPPGGKVVNSGSDVTLSEGQSSPPSSTTTSTSTSLVSGLGGSGLGTGTSSGSGSGTTPSHQRSA